MDEASVAGDLVSSFHKPDSSFQPTVSQSQTIKLSI